MERLERRRTRWCSTPTSRSGAPTATAAGRPATSSTGAAGCAYLHYGEGEYLETELAIQELPAGDRRGPRAARAARSAAARRTRPACCSSRRPPTSRCRPTATGWSSCATGSTAPTGSRPPTRARAASCAELQRGRGLRGAVGRRSSPGSTRRTATVTAESPGPPAARRAVHAAAARRLSSGQAGSAAARAVRISLGSMKRTSSWIDLELGDVAGAALAEEVHEALHELLRRARARGDAHHALALEPLLAHLRSRCRSGASRRRGRAPPRPGGSSSTSCASRSPAPGRTRAPSGGRPSGGWWWRSRCRRCAGPVMFGKRSRSRRMMSRVSSTESVVWVR